MVGRKTFSQPSLAPCPNCDVGIKATLSIASLRMNSLPDTNACISLLRRRTPSLVARRAADIVLCSVVVYELRYGAERSSNPAREHAKLDVFLETFVSLPFDDACAHRCAQIRAQLEEMVQSPAFDFARSESCVSWRRRSRVRTGTKQY